MLTNAANSIGAPIFLIEVGEHYESGFDSSDPWYPLTVAGQRQFLIDVNGVLKNLPNHLGMGMDYWDAEGVNTSSTGGGFTNGDGRTDATYAWNGLTLFDNADTSGTSVSSAANYSAILGRRGRAGRQTRFVTRYALINVASGGLLSIAGAAGNSGTPLSAVATDGGAILSQRWFITSNGDGYLQIANFDSAQGSPAQVLDNSGLATSGSASCSTLPPPATSQEWNLVTAGSGKYTIVNKAAGWFLLPPVPAPSSSKSPTSTALDWIVPANNTAALANCSHPHYRRRSLGAAPPSFTFSASQSSVTLATGANTSVIAHRYAQR